MPVESRTVAWGRRPEAARLLAQLADSGRGWDAIVVGEYERAFYGSQYAMTAPLLGHYGVQLWMPEAGGRVDFSSEHDEQAMIVLGLSSKREVTRTSIRVRTAMAVQAREQGRYLGGRPPYGYRLGDAGPHPNKAHAAWGRRAHRLEPDPETGHVVRWIFAQRLAGHSVARIARALNEAGVPCPSAADPGRNPQIILGPALGGALAGLAGVSVAFGVNAVSFAVSALLLTRIGPLPPVADPRAATLIGDTMEGLHHARRNPAVRGLTLGTLVFVTFAAIDNVALVYLVKGPLHGTSTLYGLVAATFGVGMIGASVALSLFAARRPAAFWLIGGVITGGGASARFCPVWPRTSRSAASGKSSAASVTPPTWSEPTRLSSSTSRRRCWAAFTASSTAATSSP
jgi:DNA invertase Pin-like site-specific DNA recombinase